MNDRVVALRVGIVLLAAGFITGFMIILLGEGRSLLQGRYSVHLRFPKAPGVAVDTPVRKDGVLIGRVSHVELRDEGGVVVSARIDSGRKIFKDEECQIRSSSLLGDAVLEFVRIEGTNQPHQPYVDGDFLGDGKVASDPIQVLTNLEGDMRSAMNSIETAATNFSGLSTRLQDALGTNDDRLQRIMQKSEATIDQVHRTAKVFEDLAGDPEISANLRESLRQMPQTLRDLQSMMVTTRETLDGFKGMQERVEKNLDNIEPFTKTLGDRGSDIISNANKIANNLEQITAIGADLAERISNADGSLAKLIRDDELYDQVLGTVRNINDFSRQLRPIMSDVRVITDKLARDPGGELGLKRALDRRPVGAGIKGVPGLRESWSMGPEEE